jgi:hypothetical protein
VEELAVRAEEGEAAGQAAGEGVGTGGAAAQQGEFREKAAPTAASIHTSELAITTLWSREGVGAQILNFFGFNPKPIPELGKLWFSNSNIGKTD